MSSEAPPGSPPLPPADFAERELAIRELGPGTVLFRIHRTKHGALYFGRETDPMRRQRWDAPDASYGVCYMAQQDHIAFAETLLRDPGIGAVHVDDLRPRSLAEIEVLAPGSLRVVEMNDEHLNAMGADAGVGQGPYSITWAWSQAISEHPSHPDGIRYRARHDDSGFSLAIFESAGDKLAASSSLPLLDPDLRSVLGGWLDRYKRGLVE